MSGVDDFITRIRDEFKAWLAGNSNMSKDVLNLINSDIQPKGKLLDFRVKFLED